jgi:hypothetical protein
MKTEKIRKAIIREINKQFSPYKDESYSRHQRKATTLFLEACIEHLDTHKKHTPESYCCVKTLLETWTGGKLDEILKSIEESK